MNVTKKHRLNGCFLAEMLGFTHDEIIGAMPSDLLDVQSEAKFAEEYEKRRSGKISSRYEVTSKGKGRDPLPVVVAALGIYDESGGCLGSVGRVSPKHAKRRARDGARPPDADESKKALCVLVNSMLPSLISMQSRERMRNVLDFVERHLRSDAENGRWRSTLKAAGIRLTATKIALCAMIRNGIISRQIADIMGVCTKTVAFHRGKLRKKLGIVNTKETLERFLSRTLSPVT